MFDFDKWMNLAATNPEEFERQRKAALLEVVKDAPARSRESLSSLVEGLCAPQEGTPLERAVRAQNMMMSSLVDLQVSQTELLALYNGSAPALDVGRRYSRLATTSEE